MFMSIPIREHLSFLYGQEATAVADALHRQIAPQAEDLAQVSAHYPSALTEHDALLITYADQVTQPGERPLQTLHRFTRAHLSGVVSGVHLLPFYPSSSDDGFSVMDYASVDPAYGNWDDVRAFQADFDLMFDAVFNHASAQGDWFRRSISGDPAFADFFIRVQGDPDLSAVVRPRTLPLLTEFSTASGPERFWTTFSADQVDLNFANPQVLARVMDALLLYVKHGARFIRLDAVTFLWKRLGTTCVHLPETHRIIQLFRSILNATAPGVVLITETNVPHSDNVSYFGDGTNEATLVYNFALPGLILHAVTTGNTAPLTRWAQSLRLPSDRVTFFNFLASHDGIGLNGVRGILSEEQIGALANHVLAQGGFVSFKSLPDGRKAPYELNINLLDALAPTSTLALPGEAALRFLTSHAAMLCLQGVPGLYFHSILGKRGDRTGALLSGIPRRINRQKFTLAELDESLREPDSLSATVLAGFRQLLAARRSHPAFNPAAPQEVLSVDEPLFAVQRRSLDGSPSVLCLHNFSSQPVELPANLAPSASLLVGLGPSPRATDPLGPWETRWLQLPTT